jgi:hypothetical protein
VAAIIVAAGAGVAGGWFFLSRGSNPPSQTLPQTGQPQTGLASPGPGGSSSPSTSQPPSTGPSPSPSPSDGSGGSEGPVQVGLVAIGPAADQPGARHVASFLSRYFESINTQNYAAYRALYDPVSNPAQSESGFLSGYRSTQDTGMTLVRLVPSGAGWLATVTFTSHQDPSDSLLDTPCTQWRVHYLLAPSGSTFVLEHLPAGLPPQYQAC